MRDLSLLAILLGFSMLALSRPWLGVLGLAIAGFMHPFGYATGFMNMVPAFLVLFLVTGVAYVLHFPWRNPRLGLSWDWRLPGLALLWIWFAYTTEHALAPSLAWDKFYLVLRILPPLVLLFLLIDNRDKFNALMATIALAIGMVALKGGYWAVMTGFQDRVYGPPGSQYQDNNEFAVALAMAVPLLLFWRESVNARASRAAILAGVAICYLAAMSSWSRGGLMALGVVTLLVLLQSRRKLLAIPLVILALGAMAVLFPDTWLTRMTGIGGYQADQSADSRLDVWKVGVEYTLQYHPIAGGGFEFWRVHNDINGGSIDWHNAYVKILAEHGLVGLSIWLTLLFGTMARLFWLYRQAANNGNNWLRRGSAMLGTALAAYAVGGVTLGITYWMLPYWLIAASVCLEWISNKSRPTKVLTPDTK